MRVKQGEDDGAGGEEADGDNGDGNEDFDGVGMVVVMMVMKMILTANIYCILSLFSGWCSEVPPSGRRHSSSSFLECPLLRAHCECLLGIA